MGIIISPTWYTMQRIAIKTIDDFVDENDVYGALVIGQDREQLVAVYLESMGYREFKRRYFNGRTSFVVEAVWDYGHAFFVVHPALEVVELVRKSNEEQTT